MLGVYMCIVNQIPLRGKVKFLLLLSQRQDLVVAPHFSFSYVNYSQFVVGNIHLKKHSFLFFYFTCVSKSRDSRFEKCMMKLKEKSKNVQSGKCTAGVRKWLLQHSLVGSSFCSYIFICFHLQNIMATLAVFILHTRRFFMSFYVKASKIVRCLNFCLPVCHSFG